MNEQIKQLALEAGLVRNGDWGMKRWEGPRSDSISDQDLEKFAQLLIQACGNWFNDRLVVEPDYGLEHRVERNRAVIGVMKEFNQHFG